MREKLVQVWKNCDTKGLAEVFKKYMDYKEHMEGNAPSYRVCGDDYYWNKVECYYDNFHGQERARFGVILRKELGSYMIIEMNTRRAFEVDHRGGILIYDEELLQEMVEKHEYFFNVLCSIYAY
ncbi:MAG: zinc ribbon domain-containing protein [Lachnospiraceae bacterium]|nr:zinc ribbon domain-containing protein [Lachnospiraceae bacterium]